MCGKNFKADRAASILVEADLGNDEETAKRWGITARTVRKYRALATKDPEFSALCKGKKDKLDRQWGKEARATLRMMMRKLNSLVQQAGPEQIREVAGAVKIVGELEVTRGAIQSDEQPGAVQQDRAPAQAGTVVAGRILTQPDRPGLAH